MQSLSSNTAPNGSAADSSHPMMSISPHITSHDFPAHPCTPHAMQQGIPVSIPIAVSSIYPLSAFDAPSSANIAVSSVPYAFSEQVPTNLHYMLPPDVRNSDAIGDEGVYRTISGNQPDSASSPPSQSYTAVMPDQITSTYAQTLEISPSSPSPQNCDRDQGSKQSFDTVHASQPLAHGPLLQCPVISTTSTDTIVRFDGDSGRFPKRVKASSPSQADPYAAAFLRDRIGEEKWQIFSSRLFERRFSAQKPRTKAKGRRAGSDDNDARSGGASAVEFLVKVEVVKEILRSSVPHPYNPLKSLTYAFEASPTGQVTLTRSTVLALSGWSNTQFSYWARRSEAVSVLAEHDPRLRAVALALSRRLREGSTASAGENDGDCAQDEDGDTFTGKGLDAIIEEVKKRTGASQFLRGNHSSLDPFGTAAQDADVDENGVQRPPVVYMPTFQAQMYRHSPPPAATQPLHTVPQNVHASPPRTPDARPSTLSYTISESRASTPEQRDIVPPPPRTYHFAAPLPGRSRRAGVAPRKPGGSGEESGRRELFPVSDSRSEVQTRPSKRRLDATSGDTTLKRSRLSGG